MRSQGSDDAGRVPAGREAQVLGVRFPGDRKPEALGVPSRLGLRHRTDREQGAPDLPLPQHVEHVGLILLAVHPAQQPPRAVVAANPPDVMAGRDRVDAKLLGPAQERPELDQAVAAGARVRRASGFVLGHEIADDLGVEVLGEVADLEGEPPDARDLGGVGPRPRSAAPMLDALQMDQVHV